MGDPATGHCMLCDYGPVPVVWAIHKHIDEEEEIPVCALCRDGGLVKLHGPMVVSIGVDARAPAAVKLGAAFSKITNAMIDAEGPARREVVESLLRGDGLPSGEYDSWG